jgi:hypothetical protein
LGEGWRERACVGGEFSNRNKCLCGKKREKEKIDMDTHTIQAYNYLESPTKYFQTRAKLGAKLSRHRSVFDYRQSLLEADSLEYLNLKMAATELRNSVRRREGEGGREGEREGERERERELASYMSEFWVCAHQLMHPRSLSFLPSLHPSFSPFLQYLVAYDLLSKNEDKLSTKDQQFGSRMTI